MTSEGCRGGVYVIWKEGEDRLLNMKTFINDKLGVFIEVRGEISKDRYAIIAELNYQIQFIP